MRRIETMGYYHVGIINRGIDPLANSTYSARFLASQHVQEAGNMVFALSLGLYLAALWIPALYRPALWIPALWIPAP
jgi:hypothetical protein